MSPLGYLLLAIIIALPVAWLVAEFRGSRPLRVSLGLLAIGIVAFSTWGVTTIITTIDYNAWYGSATGDLIKTSLHQIEDGHLDTVLRIWRGLDQQYQPGYESRARYRELVEDATRRMRDEQPAEPGSAWDASMFKSETWVGHWEDGHGYWLVINDLGRPFDIIRSGDPPTPMHSVSVSPDFTVLKFKEENQWAHTLTLNNKYEATHEWFDVVKGEVWQTRTMYKLIRASNDRKRMTQQTAPAGASRPTRSETN